MAGMCGIIADWELVMRVWASGYWVGHAAPGLQPNITQIGEGNSHIGEDQGHKCWGLQQELAGLINGARWPRELELSMCK